MSLKYDFSLMCPDVIAHNARVSAEDIAVVCEDERLTWRELDERTNRFANLLRAQGLGKGDKVALFLPASLDAFIAFWGSAKAGCVTVPLNVMLDGDSLARLAGDSDAVVMIAGPETEPTLDAIREQLPLIDDSRWFTAGPGHDRWRSLRDLLPQFPTTPCGVKIDPFDIITILYTSGTTGHPKGIEHTHVSRMMYPYGFAMGLKIDRYSVAVLGTPPYASGTWITMIPTMYRGGTVVILPKFSPEAFLAAVERERGTHAFLVPTQWIAILAHAERAKYDVSSLRCIVTSGQPLAEKTYHALEEAIPNAGIHEVYGFSEGFATLRLPEDAVRGKRSSVGKPLMLEDIRIVDEAGVEVPAGESGEIVVHSIGMMTGYYKKPELTEEATWTAPDGRSFMRTGDIGHLDKDGFLFVSGRLKDMIKSGGINIFAVDIEQVFMRHPDVSEAAAIGVPHPKWGETPLVIVIPTSGAEIDPEQLRHWANERLAKYQRVSQVLVRADLPRAVYGKVAKAELRKEFGWGKGL
ncbi:class I adenylate-forming enzyme family protein [Amycolatopsis sp.]|uniref:class I adenylate-forming enzyme family protein n=1 Tax=Amycolatopsis sp. TaxID=37632 RepID=UPI002C0C3AF3|nr:AMP-binding protein [Amycolatopsis sp.]HVV09308.1 AMP-binding protein [Amycolatopsis sp.]